MGPCKSSAQKRGKEKGKTHRNRKAPLLLTHVFQLRYSGCVVFVYFVVFSRRCVMLRRSTSTSTTPFTCLQRVTNSRTSVYFLRLSTTRTEMAEEKALAEQA